MTFQELLDVLRAMTPEQRACNAMAFFPINDTEGLFYTVQSVDPAEMLGTAALRANIPDNQRFMVSVKRTTPLP